MEKEKSKKGNKKGSKTLLIIIIIVAVLIIAFAAYKLLGIYSGYKAAEDTYANIEKSFETKETKDSSDSEDYSLPFEYDYNALLSINEDAIGWLYAEDLFSYPVVLGHDNDTYLHQLIDGTYNGCGTLFVDCNFPKGLDGTYSIIYGHNMNDGSMFGRLSSYEDPSFYESHQKIHVMIRDKHYIYQVFGAFTADVSGYIYNDTVNNVPVKDFVKQIRQDNLYEMYDGEIDEDDHILILSTCTDNSDVSYRFIVALVREKEVK